jgi:superfamily II DNA or RNA helicase
MIKLREYQREGLRYLLRQDHGALYWDMRLGKTVVAIRRAKLKKKLRRALVVAPFSAMQGWEDDLINERQGSPCRIVGTAEKRRQLLRLPATWNLINWQGYQVVPEIATMDWDLIICDESHYLKNPESRVSNFYAENFRNAETRLILSGTPAPESELEYYQQMRFLDHSILGYKNFYEFRGANFTQGTTFDPNAWNLSHKGRAFMEQRLARYCSFLKRRDLNLGSIKVYNKRLIEFDAPTRAMYRKCEEEFILSWRDSETETIWATQKHIWLRRLCGGLLPREEGGADFVWLGKAQEMASMLMHELKREPVIIWCHFIEEVKFLSEYLAKRAHRKVVTVYGAIKPDAREKARRAFQRGEADTFIGQPDCFKEGSDLSRADIMMFYSSPEGATTRQQVEDRFITVQKTGSVLIIDWAVADSVEEDNLISLVRKESQAERMRRAVKRMQRGPHYAK